MNFFFWTDNIDITDNISEKNPLKLLNFCSTDLYMLFKILFPAMDTKASNINMILILHRKIQKVKMLLYLNIIPTK